jgi:hypothetical protein
MANARTRSPVPHVLEQSFSVWLGNASENVLVCAQPQISLGAWCSAQLGRGLLAEDQKPGALPVVVLSHTLWRDRFAGDAVLSAVRFASMESCTKSSA